MSGSGQAVSYEKGKGREREGVVSFEKELDNIKKEYVEKKKKKASDAAEEEAHAAEYAIAIERLSDLFDTVRDDKTQLDKVIELKKSIDKKYDLRSPPFIKLSEKQEALQQAARDAIEEWNAAGTGSDYDELPPELQAQVNTIIESSGISEILAGRLIKVHSHFNTPEKMLVLLNSIKKLFQMKIAESCFNLQSGIDINMDDQDDRNYIVTLATTCVDCILGAFTGPTSLLTFAVKALVDNPQKAVIDTASLGLANMVLVQCTPPVVGKAVAASKDLVGEILKFMVTNPAESFVSGQWTYDQLKNLYEIAIKRMYPDQDVRSIRRVVDSMDENFLQGSRAGLVGDAVADTTTLTGKLSWVSHKLKSAFVGQAEFMGKAVRNAISFPNFMFNLAVNAFEKVKRLSDNMALCLMDRYKIIPGESFETFENLFMHALSAQGLFENEKVQRRAIRLLRRGNSETVWDQCVRVHSALHGDATGKPIPPPDSQGSTTAFSSGTPKGYLTPIYPGSTGILPHERDVMGEIETTLEESGQNGRGLQDFRYLSSSAQDDPAQADPAQGSAPQSRASARGGNQEPLSQPSSAPSSFKSNGANLSAAFGANLSAAFGGRSRSRKRSVSKRTRRKGVAKKQKSNKNKRQSRRKVRRASSRKGRK